MKKYEIKLLGWADRIRERERNKVAQQEKARRDWNDQVRIMRQYVIDSINLELQKLGEKVETKRYNLAPGTRAVLNVYKLGADPYNGWDGGPSSLTKNVPEKDKPIIVTVLGMGVNYSYAHELVENWLDRHVYEHELIMMYNLKNAFSMYSNYRRLNSKAYLLGDEYGIYMNVDFETESSFKPRWGLNVHSFLNVNSIEGKKTIELWAKELALTAQIEKARKALKDLEAEKDRIVSLHFNNQNSLDHESFN